MSIHIGKKNVDEIYAGKKLIVAKYEGLHKIWEAIMSCFGNGLWIKDKPWINNDSWKNL